MSAPLSYQRMSVETAKLCLRSCLCRCRHNHDLRHMSVALTIAGGAHPKAIQARMGHSSIAVTLDRYGHLLPSLDADIADGFDREMKAAKANRDRKVIHANFGDDALVGQAVQRKKLG